MSPPVPMDFSLMPVGLPWWGNVLLVIGGLLVIGTVVMGVQEFVSLVRG